jgi:hypothetical protein
MANVHRLGDYGDGGGGGGNNNNQYRMGGFGNNQRVDNAF